MKLFKQEEVDKAAKKLHSDNWGADKIHFSADGWDEIRQQYVYCFKAGVDYAEKEFSKLFPNGFESWYETFYEVVCEFFYIDGQYLEYKYPLLERTQETKGIGGLYELAKELTDKFELIHKGREWDGEFYKEINDFLEIELSK